MTAGRDSPTHVRERTRQDDRTSRSAAPLPPRRYRKNTHTTVDTLAYCAVRARREPWSSPIAGDRFARVAWTIRTIPIREQHDQPGDAGCGRELEIVCVIAGAFVASGTPNLSGRQKIISGGLPGADAQRPVRPGPGCMPRSGTASGSAPMTSTATMKSAFMNSAGIRGMHGALEIVGTLADAGNTIPSIGAKSAVSPQPNDHCMFP
jgi:hypothetical protein